ncbi:UNVERIFIED_ORG: hypothetical protein ABIC62_003308 [Burkholderia sp. 1595]|uniref:Uncharacterized protein n=1 Tax=Paraburkholderia terricola TaxID=169427 RepID=A0ABU1LQH8_9BURK|nr:hypothetical protein [Paraburkholderia terricola]MDR6482100.1 hypothetical protein [Paraburkholderia terricola]
MRIDCLDASATPFQSVPAGFELPSCEKRRASNTTPGKDRFIQRNTQAKSRGESR